MCHHICLLLPLRVGLARNYCVFSWKQCNLRNVTESANPCIIMILIRARNSLSEKFDMIAFFPQSVCLFRFSNGCTRVMCVIFSKLTLMTPEQCQWPRCGIFLVNFEKILHLVLIFPLLTLSKYMPSGLESIGKHPGKGHF